MTTLNLKYKRFVRQVTMGTSVSKYTYIATQRSLYAALQSTTWKQSRVADNTVTCTINSVTASDGHYTTYISDKYDAYKQGGDGVVETASQCGYAGVVAYRYKLPTGYAANLSKVVVPVTVDRYCRSGVRIALELSNSSRPNPDWGVIRGTNAGSIVTPSEASEVEGVETWGFLGKKDIESIVGSNPAYGEAEFSSTDFPALATTTRYQYLYVYLSLEDYTDRWTAYNDKQNRAYYIEGSATLSGASVQVTFDGAVTPDQNDDAVAVVADGIVPAFAQGVFTGRRVDNLERDSISGMHRLYQDFLLGGGTIEVAKENQKALGAGFSVRIYNHRCEINSSVFCVPFVAPRSFTPVSLNITFPALKMTEGVRFYVYASEQHLTALPEEVLKDPSLYDAASDVKGWVRLGVVEEQGTTSFDLSWLAGRFCTIAISAYLPIEHFDMNVTNWQGTPLDGYIPNVTVFGK